MSRERPPKGAADGSEIGRFHLRLLDGDTSCEERVSEELRNIESYNKKYNAFITIFGGDKGLALSRARILDARLAKRDGTELSPLYGVPLTIKDNTFLGGFPTTAASLCFSDFVPQANATVVDQLLEAGSVPLGKTNLHELALGVMGTSGLGGPIHNPVDPSRISGGSSGGSAVSVALSKGALLSTGSDTGGSVRVPAALCGICGFKPSPEVLSTEGLFPLSGSLDHTGLFAKTMPDLAIGFRTVIGSRAVPQERRLKLGVPTAYFVDDMDSQVSKDFRGAVDALEASDRFEVKEVRTDGPEYQRYAGARAVITIKEASWFYEQILISPRTKKKLHKDVLALMGTGLKMGMMRYMQAMNMRADAIRSVSRLMKEIDLLAMPSCLVVAPKIEEALGNETGKLRRLLLRNTELFNLTGMPAISLPAGRSKAALPTGLQLIGRFQEDELVLGAAETAWSVLHG